MIIEFISNHTNDLLVRYENYVYCDNAGVLGWE